MGVLISRLKGKQSTVEILKELDKEIEEYQECMTRLERQHRAVVRGIICYAFLAYVIGLAFGWLYLAPVVWLDYLPLGIPGLAGPLVTWGLIQLLHMYYQRKLKQSDEYLEELKKKKTNILNKVKEEETYKAAKEILEKFDPEYQKAKREERMQAELREFEIRRRIMNTTPMRPSTSTPVLMASAHATRGPSARLELTPAVSHPPSAGPPRTPRPIPARDRTVVDRLLDFLVGDGPGNRFALICNSCHGHNGMALKEEFEYIEFRCCYCGFYNPSRKKRPQAPKLQPLPAPPPLAIDSQPHNNDDGSSIDDEVSRATSAVIEEAGEESAEPKVESPPSPTPSIEDNTGGGDHCSANSTACSPSNGTIITECTDSLASKSDKDPAS